MIRFLAILLLATTAVLRFSLVEGSSRQGCDQDGCLAASHPASACCDCAAQPAGYCPSSGGPCRCGLASSPEPGPAPITPRHQSERESVTGIVVVPAASVTVVGMSPRPHLPAGGSLNPLAGLTHNEIRSLLGIWHT